MSTQIMSICWPLQRVGDHKITPTEKSVLISLADNANDQGGCWPSIRSMEIRTCLSRRTIFNALRSLERIGVLATDSREGRSSFYTIDIDRCRSCTRAADAPVQELHPTRASDAPPPVQELHPTRATAAPRTVNEPSEEPSREPEGGTDLLGDAPIAASRTTTPKRPKAKPLIPPDALPVGVDESLWADFEAHRKKIKKPMTAEAAKRLVAKLERMAADGHDIAKALEESIINGWQGVFEPKDENHGPTRSGNHAQRSKSAAERFWARRQGEISGHG